MSMSITVGDDRDDDTEPNDRDSSADRDDDDSDEGGRASSRDRSSNREERDDVSEDDDAEPEGGWEAEARRLRSALAKSNATGLRRRNQLKALRAAEAKADDDTDDDDRDEEKPEQKSGQLDARQLQRQIEKAKKEGRKEAEREYKRDLLSTKAETRLERAGVSERNLRLLKAQIDLDDFADDPNEEIDRLKVEFPDLFKASRGAKRRINGGDDRDGGRKRTPMTPSQRQAAQLRGGA